MCLKRMNNTSARHLHTLIFGSLGVSNFRALSNSELTNRRHDMTLLHEMQHLNLSQTISWRQLNYIWTPPTRKYRSLSKLCKYSTLVLVTFVHPHHYHHCSGSRCPMLPTICRPDKQHKSAALISKSSGLSSMKSKRKKFWRSGGVNRAHQFYHTGDGRNPKQPPGMYKTL